MNRQDLCVRMNINFYKIRKAWKCQPPRFNGLRKYLQKKNKYKVYIYRSGLSATKKRNFSEENRQKEQDLSIGGTTLKKTRCE